MPPVAHNLMCFLNCGHRPPLGDRMNEVVHIMTDIFQKLKYNKIEYKLSEGLKQIKIIVLLDYIVSVICVDGIGLKRKIYLSSPSRSEKTIL